MAWKTRGTRRRRVWYFTLLDMASDAQNPKPIRLNIPARFYVVPCAAFMVGSVIGLVRGGRTASLRFLAENVHRAPTTVQGWYFYNKTKNYKVMLGGLKGAALEGGRVGAVGVGWVGMEWVVERMGWGEMKEIGAAIGTAVVYSVVYRVGWKTTKQIVVLGSLTGVAMKGLKLARGGLEGRRTDPYRLNNV